jgi:ATP-dependent Lhr-like helicase
MWGDDGFVVRFPDMDQPPDPRLVMPDPDEVQSLVVRQLGATALFAAKFRENAARSLLLPKRRPGMRAPLWQQRKRAADLLAVASRYGSFPVLLETYRECLRDFFDMPSLVATLTDIRSRTIRIATVDSTQPSPFAASLLFSYVASFLYDGDAPLAERRAQALAVDQAQLRELIGDAELRELLDGDAMDEIERQLQRLDPKYQARNADGVHDMLLSLGDLDARDLAARTVSQETAQSVRALVQARRVILVRIAGAERFIAVEDAARYRDGLGVPLPPGLPDALLEPVRDPLGDLVLRHARTHAPFTSSDLAARYGLAQSEAEAVLIRLTSEDRLLEGEFRPGGTRREWIDKSVLRQLRRRSLARLRREVEPVDQCVLGRFAATWQAVVRRRRGTDAMLDVIEQLQGAPLAASILETEILPARLDLYDPADLDAVMAAGEVVWVGIEPLGDRDGRLALYLADHLGHLLPPLQPAEPPAEATRDIAVLSWLRSHGASFFGAVHDGSGGGYPAETVDALWRLVWLGLVTNDSFNAVRSFTRARAVRRRGRRRDIGSFRSRRLAPPTAEGRWAAVPSGATGASLPRAARGAAGPAQTRWLTATTEQLLSRHGVLTREAASADSLPGGFGAIYPILKALEEHGRIRRGYFVAGLGATQFALPGALDLLRSLRDGPRDGDDAEVVVLSATDPANPYGATLKWPAATGSDAGRGATRTVGATVILVNGALVAFLARGDRLLLTWLPEAEPERSRAGRAVAHVLIARARRGDDSPHGMLIEEIDGGVPSAHATAPWLIEAGFIGGAMGFQATFPTRPLTTDGRKASAHSQSWGSAELAEADDPRPDDGGGTRRESEPPATANVRPEG